MSSPYRKKRGPEVPPRALLMDAIAARYLREGPQYSSGLLQPQGGLNHKSTLANNVLAQVDVITVRIGKHASRCPPVASPAQHQASRRARSLLAGSSWRGCSHPAHLLKFGPVLFALNSRACSQYRSCSDCQARLQSQTGMVVDIEAIQAAMQPSARAQPTPLLTFPNHQFAVFIIFSWNYKLFWSSLQTFVAAGWGKRIIIIDNSLNRLIVNDSGVNALVGEVIPTRVRLTFLQAQNMIADIAIERNYTFFFWGHSDVALLASNATALFAEEVMACMEKAMAEEADWGVVFFRYDWFSAVRTEVVRVVRYDTFITVYKSDCDFHPRVRQKWRTLNHSGVCRGCKIQVLDMKRGLKLPLDDYEATKEILTAEGVTLKNRNRWKKQEWSLGEQIGWYLWEHTSWHYFRYKWGHRPPGHKMCSVEEKLEENSGKPNRLRQQPFETVHHLLPNNMRHPVREAGFAAKLQRML